MIVTDTTLCMGQGSEGELKIFVVNQRCRADKLRTSKDGEWGGGRVI